MTVARLLTEGLAHSAIDVCTLTYRDRDLPEGGSVSRPDVAAFRKRLRTNYEYNCARDPLIASLSEVERVKRSRLRFFIALEYGGRFQRPHAHAVIFGADRRAFVNGVSFTSLVHDAWRKGSVHWGRGWCAEAAVYCASYIAKGHTTEGLAVLEGRAPECAIWPDAPGLGVPGLPVLLAELLGGRDVREVVASEGDLPSVARLGGRDWRLGSFLLDRLRLVAGLSGFEIDALKARLVEERRLAARDVLPERLAELALGDLDFANAVVSMIGG